ncbi:GntR family transcriptional regulator [Shewanella sp. WXL01]|uniref:GntR family transcriptional regulator n=1 Tax=Shewanella sp. WXL01 TaxID=2709721 RepID=UPI00143841C3|nr:GntR family transcriptional regulator [Shewanella sp. WXL01]NKF52093.1 GntR family transcriptional regulator [Shewanella sp. WXL01]
MLELINVNPNSGEPIYRQLHDQIVRLIVGGQVQPDDTLPSVRQIAEHLTVNPMTVSRAMQQLVEQGWVERRRGQPSRIAHRDVPESSNSQNLLQPQVTALVEQASQLGVKQQDLIELIREQWPQD